MVKVLDFMKKLNANKITALLFSIYIGVFFVMQILTPTRDFSEYENRNLSLTPTFTADTFLDGSYTQKLETYITDQFPYRSFWVSLKSSSEFILTKKENGLVYFGDDYTLIDKFTAVNYDAITSNLDRISKFSKSIDIPVYFSLVPTQSAVYEWKLDWFTPVESQYGVISYVRDYLSPSGIYYDINYEASLSSTYPDVSPVVDSTSNVKLIDLYDTLMNTFDTYTYYKSDHHWTSLGAYYAYEALGNHLSYEANLIDSYNVKLVDSNFKGTSHSKSPIPWFKSDHIYTYVENQEIFVDWGNGPESALLYDDNKLNQKNKYEYFLGGNPPVAILPGQGSGVLLLIRDSYSNALAPFLIDHYEEVHLIDLRTCRLSMSEYITTNNVTEVLICYSLPNFCTDKNLAYLR